MNAKTATTFSKVAQMFTHLAVLCMIIGASMMLADYIEPSKAMIVGGSLTFYYFLYFGLRFLKASNEARIKRLPGVPGAQAFSSVSTNRRIDMQDSFNPDDMHSSLYLLSKHSMSRRD